MTADINSGVAKDGYRKNSSVYNAPFVHIGNFGIKFIIFTKTSMPLQGGYRVQKVRNCKSISWYKKYENSTKFGKI